MDYGASIERGTGPAGAPSRLLELRQAGGQMQARYISVREWGALPSVSRWCVHVCARVCAQTFWPAAISPGSAESWKAFLLPFK